jgi:peptidyl-tRNA hydrolase
MSTALAPAPPDGRGPVTYALNPRARMSSGKTLAQIAHAAVMAADDEAWVRAGCPARVIAPDEAAFDALAGSGECVAEVRDAGLTEIPPGTITVRVLR